MKTSFSQKGIALFVVIVLVLLSTLLALWAGRTAFFAGMIASNEADYQRVVEAAQAMLQDAKEDIQINIANSKSTQTRGEEIISSKEEFSDFAIALSNEKIDDAIKIYCKEGICLRLSNNLENFWDTKTTLEKMVHHGVRYGTYTNHLKDEEGNIITPNPILLRKGEKEGAWYWIEPIRFNGGTDVTGGSNTPNTSMVYRITSIAFGLKNGTAGNFPTNMAVLQTIIAFPTNSGEQAPE